MRKPVTFLQVMAVPVLTWASGVRTGLQIQMMRRDWNRLSENFLLEYLLLHRPTNNIMHYYSTLLLYAVSRNFGFEGKVKELKYIINFCEWVLIWCLKDLTRRPVCRQDVGRARRRWKYFVSLWTDQGFFCLVVGYDTYCHNYSSVYRCCRWVVREGRWEEE
jgi:hypothetical protein